MAWWEIDTDGHHYWLIADYRYYNYARFAMEKMHRDFSSRLKPAKHGKPASLRASWEPIHVRYSIEDILVNDPELYEDKALLEDEPRLREELARRHSYLQFGGDILSVMGAIAWDKRALTVLQPLVGEQVEFLPLVFDEGDYWIANVVNVVDCLDYEASEINYYKPSFHSHVPPGTIKGILRHVFKPGCLDGQHIFRMPLHNYYPKYVSDDFKRLYEEHQLTGLKFTRAFPEID